MILPRYNLTLRGSGRAEIAAHGIGDAEARIEKELKRAVPGGFVEIAEIRRVDDRPRIVESFDVSYRLRVEVEIEGPDEESARRAAIRATRAALEGTRFRRVAWAPAGGTSG